MNTRRRSPFGCAARRIVRYAILCFAGSLAGGVATAQETSWREVAPMSASRSEMRAVVIGDKFYVAAGFDASGAQLNSLEAYDPAADAWTTLAPAPIGMDHHMMAAHGGKLFVLKYAAIHVYDPVTNTWSTRPDSSGMTRGDGTAVALGEYIYVIGGGPLPIQRYHVATRRWETRASLQTSRGHLNAVVLDGKIWVLGGRAGNAAFRTVEIYDPVANAVTAGPPMDSVRSGHAAEVVNGKIVVAGGEVPAPNRLARTAEIYDPATGDWTFLPEMPLPVHGVASASWSGRFYLLGGATVAYSAVNTNRAFYLGIPGSVGVVPRSGTGTDVGAADRSDALRAVFPWKRGFVRPDGRSEPPLRLVPARSAD